VLLFLDLFFFDFVLSSAMAAFSPS
jgi:hypothetical protein